jgi:hypothetical protein
LSLRGEIGGESITRASRSKWIPIPFRRIRGNLVVCRLCGFVVLWMSFALLPSHNRAVAQSAGEETDTDYERESENPVTRFYTLPLRYKSSFEDGFYNATTNNLELSNAVLPIPLDDDWFIIARTKGAFVSQAPKQRGNNWEDGLNDAQTTLFLSPARATRFFWGAGPVILLPTATNSTTGMSRWGSGPSIALVWQDYVPWTVGIIANNVWSFGGPPSGSSTNSLLLNPIVSYRFGDGWSLSTSPNITANWASKNDKRWTVPVGGGIGKAFKIGAQPMTLKFETYYNVVRAGDNASVWGTQLTLSFLFGR